MNYFIALLSGVIFGLGLLLSAMVDPQKVQNFLDIFGQWDYSLAFVMIGALMVAVPSFQMSKHRPLSLLNRPFAALKQQIERPLAVGAVLFGVGWGIAGMCPAPAVLVASLGHWQGIVFCAAMLVGMMLFRLYEQMVNRSSH